MGLIYQGFNSIRTKPKVKLTKNLNIKNFKQMLISMRTLFFLFKHAQNPICYQKASKYIN